MPATLETITVELPAVETVEGRFSAGYPLLQATGAYLATELQAVVLENRWLRAVVLPALGGRVVGLDPEEPAPTLVHSDVRGVRLDWGVELTLDGRERPNSMGPVDFQVLEEEGVSAVILGELVAETSLSWHARVSLPEDRAALRFDVRIFNRELRQAPYAGGLLLRQSRLANLAKPGTWAAATLRTPGGELAPRQTDSFTFELAIGHGFGSGDALLCPEDAGFELRALEPMPGHKIVVRVGGRDLETRADLDASSPARFDLGAPPEAVAVLSPEGAVRFRWEQRGDPSSATIEEAAVLGDRAFLAREAMNAGSRAGAHVALAMADLRDGDVRSARLALEDALLYNGDDPLAWWLQAAMDRREGIETDGPALLNAHFLAPFEPMLRAEAFLATPPGAKHPSDVVRPMADDPHAMVEVAVRLHELGWFDDLSRWVDECLRHDGHPMLRYLLADALLLGSRMRTEAAVLVAAAANEGFRPPFPWRVQEIRALRRLAEAFPGEGVERWLQGPRT